MRCLTSLTFLLSMVMVSSTTSADIIDYGNHIYDHHTGRYWYDVNNSLVLGKSIDDVVAAVAGGSGTAIANYVIGTITDVVGLLENSGFTPGTPTLSEGAAVTETSVNAVGSLLDKWGYTEGSIATHLINHDDEGDALHGEVSLNNNAGPGSTDAYDGLFFDADFYSTSFTDVELSHAVYTLADPNPGASVPEPSSIAMLFAGGLGFLARRRRQKKAVA